MSILMLAPSLSLHHHHHHDDGHHQFPKHKPNPNTCSLTFSPPRAATQTNSKLSPTTPPFTPSLSQTIQHLCDSGNLEQALHSIQTISTNLHDQAESINTLLLVCGQRKELQLGRKVHQLLSKNKHFRQDFVTNTRLITMYAMCGSILDARSVFDETQRRNLYQWNALISGYTRNELWFDAVLVFRELVSDSGFKPNNYTLPCVIKACGGMLSLGVGKAVHGMGVKMGLSCDAFLCNALIAMYGKCGDVEEAVKVFENMPERNVVSWNAMIFGFSESGFGDDSLDAFREMLVGGDCLMPDAVTLVTVLPVCAGIGDVGMGRVVNGLAVKLGLDEELMVNNALLDMYVKCGCILDAVKLFNRKGEKDVVSWNVMIGGYAGEGDVSAVFDLVRQMQLEGGEAMRANAITILNVLPACLGLSEVRILKELHGYAFRNGFHDDDLLADAFVSSYAKCGSLSYAARVFNNVDTKTVSSWNALISGYAENGDARKALDYFHQMTSLGIQPDCFSIGCLLLACGHLKSLRDGKGVHGFVLRNGMESDFFIGSTLISLYSQCEKPFYAHSFFDGMQERNMACSK